LPLDAGDPEAQGAAQVATDEEERPARAIRCADCGAEVTSRRHQVEVGGRHAHTFMNPSAYVFHIRLFSEAPGCHVAGAPTDAYAWFPGHSWRYALCGGCGAHLGWSYEPHDPPGPVAFFGLIEERLVDEEG
jgi:hypothetical protein